MRCVIVIQSNFPQLYQELQLSDTSTWSPFARSSQCEQEVPPAIAKRISAFQQVLVVQATRPDRLQSAMTLFACKALSKKCAAFVIEDKGSFGILICGTGIGISIAANKVTGVRAALCHDAYTATATRAHNDANILCFGERVVGKGVIESMIDAFCNTEFEGGRHAGRVDKIEACALGSNLG